jgi:hypothetical protein
MLGSRSYRVSSRRGEEDAAVDVLLSSARGVIGAFRLLALAGCVVIATPAAGGASTPQSASSTALLLVIDQDSIGTGGPNSFTAADVNDDIAAIGRCGELPFFDTHEGDSITLDTGQVGDEGWFALTTIPGNWDAAGPVVGDGLRNYVGNPSLPYPHDVGRGLGAGRNPESRLDKIPGVTPFHAAGLRALMGMTACAVVYDGDISIARP